MKCPSSATVKQNKVSKTSLGNQFYRCFMCQWKYTLEKKPRGYSPELQQKAIRFGCRRYERTAYQSPFRHPTPNGIKLGISTRKEFT